MQFHGLSEHIDRMSLPGGLKQAVAQVRILLKDFWAHRPQKSRIDPVLALLDKNQHFQFFRSQHPSKSHEKHTPNDKFIQTVTDLDSATVLWL